ncbi:hypothetical protein CVT25_010752 [Psilocybe cyanescens]|uniref:Phosphatidylglycerol/phosphatidylinositol transfer protein n=1 Tax=Psilocybe cyanescens TaxID=93625 RepID=A0A409WJT9_PSICY|nr:hypothetical protein CVT25_010752 [Psilocybe cyanescens]
MKFSTVLSTIALCSLSASAQSAVLSYPRDGTKVQAGSKLTVEVDRPNSLSGSTEVAVVIAVNSCNNGVCASPQAILGQILYNGPFNPQYQSSAIGYQIPGQNFTVTLPSDLGKGPASLNVFHVALYGHVLASSELLLNEASSQIPQKDQPSIPESTLPSSSSAQIALKVPEVGLVIGLLSCPADTHPAGCAPPDAELGSVLFNGNFKPTIHEIPGEPYENFTVTVPSGFPSGTAQLSTARFHLIGAGPSPILEFNNVTLNVV